MSHCGTNHVGACNIVCEIPDYGDEPVTEWGEKAAPAPSEGPRTEAGKALLREWLMLRPDHPPNTARVRDIIEAIEREGASPAPLDVERLAEILAEYEDFPGTPSLKNRAMAEYIVARLIRPAAQEAEE